MNRSPELNVTAQETTSSVLRFSTAYARVPSASCSTAKFGYKNLSSTPSNPRFNLLETGAITVIISAVIAPIRDITTEPILRKTE
jgi:hypothetical protein